MVARLVFWRLWLANGWKEPSSVTCPLYFSSTEWVCLIFCCGRLKANCRVIARTTISLVEESNLQTPDTNPNQAV